MFHVSSFKHHHHHRRLSAMIVDNYFILPALILFVMKMYLNENCEMEKEKEYQQKQRY